MSDMILRCPKGHELPRRTSRGECTPIYCAGGARGRLPKDMTGIVTAKLDAAIPAEARRGVEEDRLAMAQSRLAARKKYLKVPEGLTGADAEAYVTRKMVDLSPLAAAELEFELTLGDDKARAEAARDVLDRTGFGKREGGHVAAGPILIINAGGGTLELPWLRREVKPDATISVGVNPRAEEGRAKEDRDGPPRVLPDNPGR
jgi:hypothetical protein